MATEHEQNVFEFGFLMACWEMLYIYLKNSWQEYYTSSEGTAMKGLCLHLQVLYVVAL